MAKPLKEMKWLKQKRPAQPGVGEAGGAQMRLAWATALPM
jgi:hypothetical protein